MEFKMLLKTLEISMGDTVETIGENGSRKYVIKLISYTMNNGYAIVFKELS